MDEHQAAALIQALDAEPPMYRTAILLLLNTGLRRGELCGLRWDDIDMEQSTLSVQRTAVYLPGKGIQMDTPKTAASLRSIKLPSSCGPMLREYRAIQAKYRLSLGDQWQDGGFVFTDWDTPGPPPPHMSTLTLSSQQMPPLRPWM